MHLLGCILERKKDFGRSHVMFVIFMHVNQAIKEAAAARRSHTWWQHMTEGTYMQPNTSQRCKETLRQWLAQVVQALACSEQYIYSTKAKSNITFYVCWIYGRKIPIKTITRNCCIPLPHWWPYILADRSSMRGGHNAQLVHIYAERAQQFLLIIGVCTVHVQRGSIGHRSTYSYTVYMWYIRAHVHDCGCTVHL
jgi:hypothetical protein